MLDKVRSALESEHGYTEGPETTDTPHTLQANLKVNKRDQESGALKETRDVKNIITNDGADYVRTTVGSAPLTSAFRWTAVGTSAAAFTSADSALHTENARSQNAFNTTSNFGQFSNVTTFTNIAATVKESGLFNRDGTNAGTMLAAQTFGQITLTTDDSLEVIWKVFFSEA
jgi:hypothetical protein